MRQRSLAVRASELVVVVVALAALLASPVRNSHSQESPAQAQSSEVAAQPPPLPAENRAPVTARVSTSLAGFSCNVPDQGLGGRTLERGEQGVEVLVAPSALLPDGGYDLVLHFHGKEPVRRISAASNLQVIVASLDKGDSSGDYAGLFQSKADLESLLRGIDATVSASTGQQAHVRSLLVSSFSAGFEAVRQVLTVGGDLPVLTGVLLLDSLYGSFQGVSKSVDLERLAPFETFARRSLESSQTSFLLTHSRVPTEGYANTAEVADTLIERLLLRVDRTRTGGTRSLERRAEEKGVTIRGYAGSDRDAHCAHLGLFPELVASWQERARGASPR